MKHLHKYQLANIARKQNTPYHVYFCTLPDCTHRIPIELALGKRTHCTGCDEEMRMSEYVVGNKIVKPLCPNCRDIKKKLKVATVSGELV